MKFLRLKVDNHLNWKNLIEQMIPKLSAACYAVRSSVHISSVNTQINLLCTLLFHYKIWNNFFGVTQVIGRRWFENIDITNQHHI